MHRGIWREQGEGAAGVKILMVNNLYAPYQKGGAELSVEALARGFVDAGADVIVATLHDAAEVEAEFREDVAIWRFPIRNGHWPFGDERNSPLRRAMWHVRDIYNRSAASDLEGLLRSERPDVVHTNNLSGFSVAAWKAVKRLGIPIVHTARDYYLLHPNSTLFARGKAQNENAIAARAWSFAKKRASHSVDCFVGISKHVHEMHLRNGYFKNATHAIIHNSVALPHGPLRVAWLRPNHPTFGYLGRLDASKGIEVLLDAMSHFDGACLLVAGSGASEYERRLHGMAPENVEFLGRTCPAEFLRRVDYLIVPSMWAEPLGRVVLEAYSQGVPVVATYLGGLADVVWDGVTGTIYDPATSATSSLVRAMQRIMEFDYQALSEACLEKSVEFSVGAIAENYLRLFRNLAGHGCAAPQDVSVDGGTLS